MRTALKALLTRHWLLTLLLMGVFAAATAFGSLNIFVLLRANLTLIAEHGTLALAEGGALQLIELIVTGYLSLSSYVLFKACERVLVERCLR